MNGLRRCLRHLRGESHCKHHKQPYYWVHGAHVWIAACILVLTMMVTTALAVRISAEIDLLESYEGRQVVFEALVNIFKEHYWNETYVDWDAWAHRFRSSALDASGRKGFEAVAAQMISTLGDDHSSWVGLTEITAGSLAPHNQGEDTARRGLGILHKYVRGTGVVIERVFPTTPAAAAGLERGDVITHMNHRSLIDITSAQADAEMHAITQQDSIKLSVTRRHQTLSLTLTPDLIDFYTVTKMPQAKMLDNNIGYLYIPTFNERHIAEEVHRLTRQLSYQGATSLILDLRDNPGGIVGELGLVLGMFWEGPWAQAYSRGEVIWNNIYRRTRFSEDPQYIWGQNILQDSGGMLEHEFLLKNPTQFHGPLVVLVSRHNSSAGEVAALVLQDLGRATVIGEPTSGNVEVVSPFELPDGSIVLVAGANTRSAQGKSFDHGVEPDVIARAHATELARGYDAPVAEAVRALKGLPFTPHRFF